MAGCPETAKLLASPGTRSIGSARVGWTSFLGENSTHNTPDNATGVSLAFLRISPSCVVSWTTPNSNPKSAPIPLQAPPCSLNVMQRLANVMQSATKYCDAFPKTSDRSNTQAGHHGVVSQWVSTGDGVRTPTFCFQQQRRVSTARSHRPAQHDNTNYTSVWR